MRALAGWLMLLAAHSGWALDRFTEADIRAFVSDQTTHVMRKEIELLMAMFSPDFRYILPRENRVMKREDYQKVQSANFAIAKLILNTIELRQIQLREDGKQAIIRTHNRQRFLIQVKDRQNIIEQEDDLIAELVLRDGKIVYLSTEKL